MTLEGRIKRLERERDHPAHPGPDPETVELWASWFTNAGIGIEESRAQAGASGYWIGHDPGAQDARRKGGHAKSRAERAAKLLPARLQPMVSLLEDALGEVHRGELDPRAASAMASLAGALVRAMTAGELEERLRALEGRGAGKVSP